MRTQRPMLVIIRGNSASGKTTLARRLQLDLGRGTANIGQDHFRRMVLREHDVPDGDNIELIRTTAEFCLGIGYNVIVEGILRRDHYGAMLEYLLDSYDGPSHVLYLDVPLEETLRRHDNRPLRAEVTPESLRNWYRPRDVLGVPGEIVLDGSLSEDATYQAIRNTIGNAAPPPEHTPD